VSVALSHVRDPATPPSLHDADLPPELDSIVMKALAKRVEDRYQSAAAMRTDIERFLAGRPIQAPPVDVNETTYFPPEPSTTSTSSYSGAALEPERRDRRRAIWLWVFGLAIAAMVFAGVKFLPSLMEQEPTTVAVPNLIGLTETEARAAIGKAGLIVGDISHETDDVVPVNQVIRQDPDRDLFVDPNTRVQFVVSLGKPMVPVPFVGNMTRKDAKATLAEAKLGVDFQEQESDLPRGTIISTNPAAGVSVAEGAIITAYFSDGPEVVPSVVGKTQEEAEAILTEAGFRPEVLTSADTTEAAGTVIKQSPAGETPAANGATVTIVVSTYVPPPSPSATPTPTADPSGSPSGSPTATP
jgi:eukaryotic-like serine/threonine-protein kinase